MSTDLTWQTSSTDLENTGQIAGQIGSRLKGGEVIELVSDLGGGKTAFVRGLAKGMGSTDKVASPSFTISREYKAGKLTLYHFDLYRLHEPGVIANELAELVDDPRAVVAVEWGEIVRGVLPEERLRIEIVADGETTRQLLFTYPATLAYLMDRWS